MSSMRFAGSFSWQVRSGSPHSLLIGLFVHDAAGLQPAADVDVPPLVPTVADLRRCEEWNAVAVRR
jgi:hypothetical protein